MEKVQKEKPKIDRRILRTRAALRKAFRELIKEKGYEAVTVENITERANIGRTTFYQHYRDKEDLYLEGFESRLIELVGEVTTMPLMKWFMESNGAFVRSIFETVQQDADFFRIVTQENTNNVYNRFREIVIKVADKLIEGAMQYRSGELPNIVPMDYIINFYTGAIWASIVWWVENDFNPSAGEMTDNFRTMFLPSVLAGLGVTRLHGGG